MPTRECPQCGQKLSGLPDSNQCCDAAIIRDIIESRIKECARDGKPPVVPKMWVLLAIRKRISSIRLFNKAIETHCNTNDTEENLKRGSEKVFLAAMRLLKEQFVVRKNGRIEIRRSCPDCGVEGGHAHKPDCDIQRCSVCGRQYVCCQCGGHDPIESIWLGEWPEDALTEQQLERQDFVDNTIHYCLEELAGEPLEREFTLIGVVRDVVTEEFESRGIVSEARFYPCIEDSD
ncbi:hypothetical protein [Rubinisphaera brasiliensis]|uniref:Uncharacterized protein n=1 Tax=Rubinisphaera brasiliensis (strain ATCC 49424 / DSM 5305 / JCM 21570 / IAM 15109 / NBRC 103401 / IFAM 1448) TaxID=756272 RepID=F0SJ54_RUBBR|nr:hypothetical protein [Rubinisphaera brasiliensis]ADY58596.1 hypothetical protein Plabr_0975 [Rubinisphaera brasiliensis DSM 5305]